MESRTERHSAEHQVKLHDILAPLASKTSNQFLLTGNEIFVQSEGLMTFSGASIKPFFRDAGDLIKKHGFIPKQLTLKFTYERPINDDIIKAISDMILKSFNQLTHFTLILPNCTHVTKKGFSHFMRNLAKCLSELTKFTLRISNCKESISQVLKDFKYLLTNPAFWKNIQHLSLDFEGCEVDNDGVKDLMVFSRLILPQLKSFYISFKRCIKISAEGIKHLVESFNLDLPALESLKVNISWCVQRTDQNIKTLLSYIANNTPNLHTLKLDFEGCSKLTDITVQEILKTHKTTLAKLTELTLVIAWCSLLSNQGLKDIFTFVLTSFPSLKKATLDFYQCSQIDSKGVRDLTESIKNGVLFYTDSHSKVEETAKGEKTDSLGVIKQHKINLQHLYLDFTQHKHNLNADLPELRQKLSCIPSLIIKADS